MAVGTGMVRRFLKFLIERQMDRPCAGLAELAAAVVGKQAEQRRLEQAMQGLNPIVTLQQVGLGFASVPAVGH